MSRLKSPVRALSPRGQLWLWLLKAVYAFVGLWKGRQWQTPLKDFEEDPRTMGTQGALYLGYKYYHHLLDVPDLNSNLDHYFQSQSLVFTPPDSFEPQTTITISAGGDLMPYALIRKENTRHLWDEVGDFFFNSDIVFANLETPIDLRKPASLVPEIMLNHMRFNGSAEMFEIFSGLDPSRQYDVLSVANNHSLDQGSEGLLATMNFLENKGIVPTGAARSAEERKCIPILEKKGVRVAFLAYTYSLNQFQAPKDQPWLINHLPLNKAGVELPIITDDVQAAREQGADVVVLSLHTGCAYQAYPSQHTVGQFHRIFEQSGADVILGSHPHNPQPMERYTFTDPQTGKEKQGFAIYSLADFVAYDIYTWCHLPLLLQLEVTKGLNEGQEETLLTKVNVLPVYTWAGKIGRQWEVRFLNLCKVLSHPEEYAFMDQTARQEVRALKDLLHSHLLPKEHKGLLAQLSNL